MRTRVKDFIEVSDHTSLDRLIVTLVALRDSLPDNSEAELKMRGDDVFGRRLSISYFREMSVEEHAVYSRGDAERIAGEKIAVIASSLDGVKLGRREDKRAA